MDNPITAADWAEFWAERGVPVLLCTPRGKVPLTPNGVNDATTDAKELRETLEAYPECNIALAMGHGLVCIDVDVKPDRDGQQELFEWEREHGKLPETWTAVTGGGGMHLVYRTGRSFVNTPNHEMGMDVRSLGSYIVVEPSVHRTGNVYYWDVSPLDSECAEADDNVYALISEITRGASDKPIAGGEGGRSLHGRGGHVLPDVIPMGERNDQLFAHLSQWQEFGRTDDEIRAEAERVNSEQMEQPLRRREVAQIVRQVLRYPKGDSLELPDAKTLGERMAAFNERPRRTDWTDSKHRFDHAAVSMDMIDSRGFRKMDGMPVIWMGNGYDTGWNAVKRAVCAFYKADTRDSERNEVVRWLDCNVADSPPSPWRQIAFSNGVLDLSSMEMMPPSRDYATLNTIPHRYVPGATSELLADTLDAMACGDDAVVRNLYECMGACLCRGIVIDKAFLLINYTGSNGKSTFLNFLRYVVGERNCCSVAPQLMGERFQSVPMMGMLANICDDIPDNILDKRSSGLLKATVTGDVVPYEVKGGVSASFRPYCTCVFSMNRMPPLGDSTGGMERRLHPIPFRARFSREDGTLDPLLWERLRTEEVAEAAIASAVAALRCAMDDGVTETEYSRSEVDEIMLTNNQVRLFLEEEGYTPEGLDHLSTAAVFDNYRDWAKESEVRNLFNRRRFTVEVCELAGMRSVKTTSTEDSMGKVMRYVPARTR